VLAEHQPQLAAEDVQPLLALVRLGIRFPSVPIRRNDEFVRLQATRSPGEWLERHAIVRERKRVDARVPVSRFSTIRVLRNTYSVPSRLIGTTLLVRVRSETLEVYRATTHLLTMPRLLGQGQHRIDYRHVI
jgi:hypothetical protein